MSFSPIKNVFRQRFLSQQYPEVPPVSHNRSASAMEFSSKSSSIISLDLERKNSVDLRLLPVHSAKDSLFSAASGWTDYRGFLNLAILLLVISNGRVALENLIKYGILISPLQWLNAFLTSRYSLFSWPNLTVVLLSNVTIMAFFAFEKLLARGILSNEIATACYVLFVILHITVPAVVVVRIQGNPLFSSCALIAVVVEALKLISYAHVNYWYRLKQCSKSDEVCLDQSAEEKHMQSQVDYPYNLSLSNLYYFMFAPTLCYELNFPKTTERRIPFILKRVSELVCFGFVSVALGQQWVIPLLKNSVAPFSEMDIKRCIERVLKLAIPNHMIWLMLFYLIFHSALNLLAEITCFADRNFYLDFWNSETISAFWKTWNIPVHRWALRHVYKPMRSNGYSRAAASLVVFVVSAFFHEYLVSVPLHMFRLWAFNGMLAQIPLSILTDGYFKGGRAGNIVVWLSLILGQPMAILMYVHDWYIIHYPGVQNLQVAPTGVI